ncbi:MAG: hypothetical protein GY953_15945, partial [bacterium]|nr:hypothetical protein [bacterium]
MKRILMIPMVVAALSGGPVPALAEGIPTFDVSNLTEAIKDGITQGQQLAELKNQFQQLIQQYNQAVANARRLGNLDELLDLA